MFSIVHFNARSLNKNFENIIDCLNELNGSFDIIAISETWEDGTNTITNYNMHGYNVFSIARTDKRGGGVALYIKNLYNCTLVTQKSVSVENMFECVTIELHFKQHKNILVSCVYRAPGESISSFCDYILPIIENNCSSKTQYVCGDFNVNLLHHNILDVVATFFDLMYALGLRPLITKPTRVTRTTATLIDNIFTNDIDTQYDSGIIIVDVSDHLPIFSMCVKSIKNTIITKTMKTVRQIKEDNIIALNRELASLAWDRVLLEEDTNTAYDQFTSELMRVYHKCCPLKYVKLNKRTDPVKPWVTSGLVNACRKKNNLYRQFLIQRTIVTERRYKLYKNKLTAILRKEKKKYYCALLLENKNNIAGTWKVLRTLLGREKHKYEFPDKFDCNGATISNKTDIANLFNNFFTNVGPDLANKIITPDGASIYDYMLNQNDNCMFLTPVDEMEVSRVVNRCKNKYSTDANELSMYVVKRIFVNIVTPVTHICNLSFKNGVFPEKMKVAKIIPIYKSGKRSDCTNYRPISLLPQISKILEKLFNARLTAFLNRYNVISPAQYGFRENMSTSHALTELVDEITASLDHKLCTMGVFIDLKKAFDTVNHQLLCKKLEFHGVRGVVLKWITSYLTKRSQFVSIDGSHSDMLDISCGVPQGSVLGPKLFIVYVNDLCNISDHAKCVLFADDTNLLCSDTNIDQLFATVASVLDNMCTWFAVNKLSLNVSKTSYMLFRSNIKIDVGLLINGTRIERVNVAKFLGVTIDEQLNWKAHISSIKCKLAKSTAILYKCSQLIDYQSMRILYCSVFLPYINYCSEIWGNTYPTNINGIVLLQKRAIRLLFDADRLAHTAPLFRRANVLNFTDLVKVKTAIFMYRAYYCMLPVNIQNKILKQKNLHATRSMLQLVRIRVVTNVRAMSLIVYGITLHGTHYALI